MYYWLKIPTIPPPKKKKKAENKGRDVAQLVEDRTGTSPSQVRFPGAARDFSPRVNFQCRLFYDARTPPCAAVCINICAHVKDPAVHVRGRWVMETLKHPACTVGGVARLCRSWLSPEKATRISHGRISSGTIQLYQKEKHFSLESEPVVHAGLAHSVTDTDCGAQNGRAQGLCFRDFQTPSFFRTRP